MMILNSSKAHLSNMPGHGEFPEEKKNATSFSFSPLLFYRREMKKGNCKFSDPLDFHPGHIIQSSHH